MKSNLKILFLIAFTILSVSSFAQKIGHINYVELIQSMPETATINKQLETIARGYEEEIEALEVEKRNKFVAYQNNLAALTQEAANEKLQELQELSAKQERRTAEAEQEFQQKQDEMLAPVFEKAQATIDKVAKDNGVACVFNSQVLLFADETKGLDLLPLAKKELGI